MGRPYTVRMKRFALPLMFLVAACGSGGGGLVDDTSSQPQTLADRLGDCFVQDATDLGSLLQLLTGLLDQTGDALPLPEVDIAGFIRNGGALPLTWDLDGDGTPEIGGTLRFIDANGDTTFPFSLGDLAGLDLENPLSLLDSIPDGSRMEIDFAFDGVRSAATNGTAEGMIVLTFDGGIPSHVQGSGKFSGDGCELDFDLDEIPLALDGVNGLPELDFGFSAGFAPDRVEGHINFDGSDHATVRGRINGGPEESFSFDVPIGN